MVQITKATTWATTADGIPQSTHIIVICWSTPIMSNTCPILTLFSKPSNQICISYTIQTVLWPIFGLDFFCTYLIENLCSKWVPLCNRLLGFFHLIFIGQCINLNVNKHLTGRSNYKIYRDMVFLITLSATVQKLVDRYHSTHLWIISNPFLYQIHLLDKSEEAFVTLSAGMCPACAGATGVGHRRWCSLKGALSCRLAASFLVEGLARSSVAGEGSCWWEAPGTPGSGLAMVVSGSGRVGQGRTGPNRRVRWAGAHRRQVTRGATHPCIRGSGMGGSGWEVPSEPYLWVYIRWQFLCNVVGSSRANW
jgi:hypothetical protein